MDDMYDVVVLGAGPVGQNVTERSRAAGLSVAVVERELVGGECSYWGCVPSKALLRPVLAVADARKVDGAREAIGGSICADGVFGRRDRYTTNYDDTGQANWVKATGADLIRGHGRLDGPRRVAVATPDDDIVTLIMASFLCARARRRAGDVRAASCVRRRRRGSQDVRLARRHSQGVRPRPVRSHPCL